MLINGRAAHRLGDLVKHCGGFGKTIAGSPNVIVGDLSVRHTSRPFTDQEDALEPIMVKFIFYDGSPVANKKFSANGPKGTHIGIIGADGTGIISQVKKGEYRVLIDGEEYFILHSTLPKKVG